MITKPDAFDRDVAQLVEELKELAVEYRWTHGVAMNKSQGDTVKVAAGTSDPTVSVFLSKRGSRRACEKANQAVVDADKAVRAALGGLGRALALADPAPGFEPLRYKADATRADIAEAREAQARRFARGEGVPE